MTRRLGSDGRVDTTQTLHNLNEGMTHSIVVVVVVVLLLWFLWHGFYCLRCFQMSWLGLRKLGEGMRGSTFQVGILDLACLIAAVQVSL